MRQPEIVPLHAVTTTNALRFAYQSSSDDETRRLLMLQNAAFLPMFRVAAQGRDGLKGITIDDLTAGENVPSGSDVAPIFADLSRDPMLAARQAMAYLRQPATDSAPATLCRSTNARWNRVRTASRMASATRWCDTASQPSRSAV